MASVSSPRHATFIHTTCCYIINRALILFARYSLLSNNDLRLHRSAAKCSIIDKWSNWKNERNLLFIFLHFSFYPSYLFSFCFFFSSFSDCINESLILKNSSIKIITFKSEFFSNCTFHIFFEFKDYSFVFLTYIDLISRTCMLLDL